MKKTVTVLLAVLLTAAMGMTVFAAGNSYLESSEEPSLPDPDLPEPGKGEVYAEKIPGFQSELVLAVKEMDRLSNNTATGVLKGSIALSNGNYVLKSTTSKLFLFNLSATDSKATGTVNFMLADVKKGSTFLVLHYTNSAWDYVANGIAGENGKCSAVVNGFSPYMVVTDATLRQPAPVKTSPKTGIR
ncbi:MAG: hypothetical protein RR275_08340 [Lachnospiraceae bacterium]